MSTTGRFSRASPATIRPRRRAGRASLHAVMKKPSMATVYCEYPLQVSGRCEILRFLDQCVRPKGLTYKYGKPFIGVALGEQRLFSGSDSDWDDRWKPSIPEANTMLWRYMSFARFCSLLERRELFFSLVGDMEDRYEGFINPPLPPDRGNPLYHPEQQVCDLLYKIARTALICCWTRSDYESTLMWKTYAGEEGVAIRTTFGDLQKSVLSLGKLPVIFGQVEYVDYVQREVPRFNWSPLFHKRVEYRAEEEVRALLPGPCLKHGSSTPEEMMDIRLDPDVEKQRGRYIPVDLSILVTKIVISPYAKPWFTEIVKSAVRQSSFDIDVCNSSINAGRGPSGLF